MKKWSKLRDGLWSMQVRHRSGKVLHIGLVEKISDQNYSGASDLTNVREDGFETLSSAKEWVEGQGEY